MITAVLDTNVIISAILIKGNIPDKILQAWREEKFELVISFQILNELSRVLFYPKIKQKKWLNDQQIEELIVSLAKASSLTPGTLVLEVIKDDPDDDKFIIAAIEQKADYIVSGDLHLKKLKEYKGIKIVTPADFLKILGI